MWQLQISTENPTIGRIEYKIEGNIETLPMMPKLIDFVANNHDDLKILSYGMSHRLPLENRRYILRKKNKKTTLQDNPIVKKDCVKSKN